MTDPIHRAQRIIRDWIGANIWSKKGMNPKWRKHTTGKRSAGKGKARKQKL